MAYDFHYTPTGTGVISGKEVLEQTEDAINDLGNTAISGVQEALDKAEQALTNSENAVDDAQTALNTANNAEGVAIQAQTDVGNLSGTVTNIGNRVTTAEGNITNLQGRMTTAEGNITNLQGRMTTAETNIGNLQTAVSTAQATANSAQQTATTARQQSYVFRYSGTAVVPNSTIAYSTIDNTDNIKSGDKILDVDGKLFEITAVDTTNQTVTVGTALIDLALDANVVHTSGNETISGDKVFNNRLIKNIDVILGTAPSTGKFSNIDIADNNKSSLLQVLGGVYDNGNSYARFFVQNKTADDGTGLSPTGTLRGCGFNINLPASSTSEGQGSITPRANKTTDFGLLSYQWRNLWCEKLFLNGTQLDPSAFALDSGVVHTSGNETVGGEKTFTGALTASRNVANGEIILQNASYDPKTNGQGGVSTKSFSVNFVTALSDTFGAVSCYGVNDRTILRFTSRYFVDSQTVTEDSVEYNVYGDGSRSFKPRNNNNTMLGESTRKWKEVYANNYYYGANNVEFSTKFVTTDTNQTISGNKTFSSNINVYNSDSSASTPNFTLRSSKSAIGTSDTDVQTIFFSDKNGASLASVKAQNFTSNGATYLLNSVNTKDTNDQIIEASTSLYILNNGRKVFRPNADNDIFLGYSLQKWKDFYTYLINGLEPSSLSLPSDRSARVDISGYITNLGNGDNNSYTVPANGYIWLHFTSINSALCYAQTSGGLTNYAQSFARYSGDGPLYAFFPVRNGDNFVVQIYTSSTAVVQGAYFIPCQGNV